MEGAARTRRRRPANKGQRYPAEILTADEVRALITACSNRAPTGIRNRALLVLLYRAGCRISEALRLLPKDLDRAAGTATVLRGKGGRRRTIGLDPGAFAVVERWLDVRAKRGISGRAPIICTLKGKPLASAYVRALMPRLARRAGNREARPRPWAPPHPRRGAGTGGPPHEPDSGPARAHLARDDEPLPRAHRARAVDRGHAGANVEPLSGSPSAATIGARSVCGDWIATLACGRHLGQLRASALQAARCQGWCREARPPARVPTRVGLGPSRERHIPARHPTASRAFLAGDDRHLRLAHRASEGSRRGDGQDAAPRGAALKSRRGQPRALPGEPLWDIPGQPCPKPVESRFHVPRIDILADDLHGVPYQRLHKMRVECFGRRGCLP